MTRKGSPMKVAFVAVLASGLILAGCSSEQAAPTPPSPAAPPAAAPSTAAGGITLPADMPSLVCADLEPAPIPKPAGKLVGRNCTDPDGGKRWIHAIYQCTDGTVWPVLAKEQPTGASGAGEPKSAEFNRCIGRS